MADNTPFDHSGITIKKITAHRSGGLGNQLFQYATIFSRFPETREEREYAVTFILAGRGLRYSIRREDP